MIGGCFCAWQGQSFIRVIPSAIFLYADRLWNADDAGVPYDDEYGRVITRLLFGGGLPEGMNVFKIVGGMLPPQKPDKKVHVEMLCATLAEVREIRGALDTLAESGHRLAAVYADMAKEAEEYINSLPDELKPLDDTVSFIG